MELIETKTEFAKRLNLTKQYVSALVKRGLPLDRKGDVRVDAALVWLRENVRPAAGRPAGSVEDGPPDLMAEKTRLIAAQASKAELELAHLRRSLMPVDDAKKVAGAFARQHRDHMLNFANRHGATIAAEVGSPAAAVIAAIEAKLRDHMNEFADTPISFEGGK